MFDVKDFGQNVFHKLVVWWLVKNKQETPKGNARSSEQELATLVPCIVVMHVNSIPVEQ